MNTDKNVKSKDIAHCPVCDANAVQPCHEPKIDDCPRGEDRKVDR